MAKLNQTGKTLLGLATIGLVLAYMSERERRGDAPVVTVPPPRPRRAPGGG